MLTIYVLLLFSIWSIRIVDSITVRGMSNHKPGEPFLIEYNEDKRAGVRSEGIFERFVRNYLFLLSTGFVGKDLNKYVRVVQQELKKMEFTYTQKLANHCKKLAKMDRDELHEVVTEYREQYDKRTPVMQDFMDAMNEVFTMQQNLRFDDYIHDIDEFARGHRYSVQEETKKILNDVIINSIDKISERDKRDLEKKLRHAIKEYLREY